MDCRDKDLDIYGEAISGTLYLFQKYSSAKTDVLNTSQKLLLLFPLIYHLLSYKYQLKHSDILYKFKNSFPDYKNYCLNEETIITIVKRIDGGNLDNISDLFRNPQKKQKELCLFRIFRLEKLIGMTKTDYLFCAVVLRCKALFAHKPVENIDNIGLGKQVLSNSFRDIEFLFIPLLNYIIKGLNKGYKTKSNRLWLITTAHFYDTEKKLMMINKGYFGKDNLIIYQHGGHNYGTSNSFCFNRFENQIAHCKMWYGSNCWGVSWLQRESREQDHTLNRKLLLVGTEMPIRSFRFDGSLRLDTSYEYYSFKRNLILRLLNAEGFDLYYRPYNQGENCLPEKDIIEMFKGSQIVTGNLDAYIGEYTFIIDHPGTTMNKLIDLNVPFYLAWPKQVFGFNASAKSVYLDLHKSKILAHTPEELANNLVERVSEKTDPSVLNDYKALFQQKRQKKFYRLIMSGD